MPSVLDAARAQLLDAAPNLAGALVYLDAGAAEVVRLSLGVELLYGLGVAAVCPLEAACPEDALVGSIAVSTTPSNTGGAASSSSSLPTRLAIFTTQLLSEAYPAILQALLVHQASLASATIYSSLSQLAHAQSAATDLGVEAYAEVASALSSGWTAALQPPPPATSAGGEGWEGDAQGYDHSQRQQQQGVVRAAPGIAVAHLPLHMVALDDSTFVLPAAADAATLAVCGERAAGYGPAETPLAGEGEEEGLSSGLSLMAHALVDVAGQLGVRLNAFACGPVSAAIAKEFMTLPQRVHPSAPDDPAADLRAAAAHLAGPSSTSKGTPGSSSSSSSAAASGPGSNSWALVLVDRSLDLATPCMHWPLDSQEQPHPLDLVLDGAPRTPQEAAAAAGWLCQGWGGGGSGVGGSQRPSRQRRATFRPATVVTEVEGLAPWDPCGLMDAPSTATTTTSSSSSSSGAGGKKAVRQQQGSGKDQSSSAAGASSSHTAATPLSVSPLGLPLWHPSDKRWLDLLAHLWPAKGRNALLLLRKLVKEALRSEKVSPAVKARLSSTVTAEELLGLVGSLVAASPDIGLRHTALLGMVCATAAAMQGARPLTWGAGAALERQLLMALPQDAGGADMLLPLLLDAIESVAAGKGVLGVDDLLQLLVVTYSLCGDRQPPAAPLYSQQEGQLKEALAAALLAALRQQQRGVSRCETFPDLVQLQQQGASEQQLRAAISSCLAGVWQALHAAAASRGKLRELRRLMVLGGSGCGVVPLVRQLLHKVQLQAELKDVTQPSAKAFQGLLGGGLNIARFGLSALDRISGASHKSKPLVEYPGVLLFVVGGLSSVEVREVKQEVAEHQYGHRPQVILGGTSLLAGRDVVRLLLAGVGQ